MWIIFVVLVGMAYASVLIMMYRDQKRGMTNADKIRDMSDEELVFFLWWFADGSGKTKDQWRDWLKQERDDNGT